jgi:DNA transposition AAA+ family ATPase
LLSRQIFFRACLRREHSLIIFFRRVSFRRKKKEDKAAKDAAKEDKGKEKPEKKAAKEEVRSIIRAWWIDGIFRQFLGFAYIYLRDCLN